MLRKLSSLSIGITKLGVLSAAMRLSVDRREGIELQSRRDRVR
jgi:hypothetical protein